MSKLVSFTYTKADGKVSERTVIELKSPNNHMLALDVSELSEEDQMLMANEVATIYSALQEEIESIKHKYDAVHSYRQFDPLRMTNTRVHA